MSGWLWFVTLWLLMSAVLAPTGVGKPREPITGGAATFQALCALGLGVCVLKGGGVL